jgi:RHS repeat-associated protein
MNQVMTKLRGWMLGLVVFFVAGAGLPAVGQSTWDLSFSTDAEMRSQIIKDFDSGASFPAGFYRIEYISGAGDYHGEGVKPNPTGPSNTYNLGTFSAISGVADTKMGSICRAVYLEETDNVPPPRGWSSITDVENAAFATSKTSIEFKHAGGQIGVQNSDTTGAYWNNYVPSGGAITFKLIKLGDDVDKYKLKILVAKSISNNQESEDGNEAGGEKSEGHQVEDSSTWLITCKVPGGLKDEEVKFDFSAIFQGVSREAVKIYDDTGTELTGRFATWPIEEGTKTFELVANTSFSAQLDLYVVDESSADPKPQINQAIETASSATVDVCPDYTDITVGGCGCESSCTGESSADPGCLRFQIGIGGIGFDEGGGYLMLLSRRPTDGIYKPDSLQFFLNDRLVAANGFTDDGDKITPADTSDAIWGEAVLTLHTDTYGYDIKFYERSGGTLATMPYRTVTVENLNGATSNDELYITETIDLDASTTPKVRMWHFEWTGASAGATDDGSWVLTEGEAGGAAGLADDTILRITERDEVWNVAGDEVTETVTVKESAGTTVVSETEEVWKVYDWGRERISMTRDHGSGDALKESWTYYDDLSGDGEDNYGRLESYQSKTGYWERYDYDADGNKNTMRQYENETLTLGTTFATEAADNIVEEYTENDSVSITGYTNDVRVEKWQIKVQGTVERTWYKIYVDEADSLVSGCTEEWSVRPVVKDPENGTTLSAVIENVLDGTDTTSIMTKSWHWVEGASGIGDNEPYDVRVMQAADGQYTVYERTIATDERTTVIRRGFSDDSLTDILAGALNADIEYGTKTTSVVDTRGNMVSTLSEKVSESDNEGDWFITALMKASQVDEFGRPTETQYFFGADAANGTNPAYTTSIVYSCCGGGEEEIRKGRDGVETWTQEDILGRTLYTKMYGNEEPSFSVASIYRVNRYDAAGRVIASGLSTNEVLGDASDLESSRTYDVAGRMKSATNEEGRKSYKTYRRVTTSGDPYTGTGVFYWETRSYGHDSDAPVSVSWTDSHGRTVLSYTGSFTGWDGTTEPSGAEELTEHTRSTSIYDWDDRMTEGRAYFNLDGLALNAAGAQGDASGGGNYLVTGTTEYDALGRAFRSTDARGNITQTVYEEGTGRAIGTKIGVDINDLHAVSWRYYKQFNANDEPVGNDRPWPTRVYTVKPGLDSAPNDDTLNTTNPNFADYTFTETQEIHTVDTASSLKHLDIRYMWSQPEHGPWSRDGFNDRGEHVVTITTRNDDPGYLLTRTTKAYFTNGGSGDGKPRYSDRFVVNMGSNTPNRVRTEYFYDDAGRQVKTATTGRGFTKTSYDAFGRTERSVFASDEGSNNAVDSFTGDIVLTESVPTYDKSGRVIKSVTYERAHDATATGLLSAAAADQARVSTNMTWRDANGRTTHRVAFGTNTPSASYDDPLTDAAPEPNSSDDYIVSKVAYDAAGRVSVSEDNSSVTANQGKKTKTFYDDLGRITHSVENWVSITDPDNPGPRNSDVNRITKNIYDNSATGGGARIETVAIDPNSDGTYGDNQRTFYIHSGEVSASERGPIPVNGRPIAVLMPDALPSGVDENSLRSACITEVITEINAGGEVFGDFSFTEYYANGQAKRSTDHRGVQKNVFYTDEGWTDYTTVTEAAGSSWDSIGDLRTQYTYGDAGEVLTVTTYDIVTGGASNETSKLNYTYDGFYNRLTEKQDHDPTANSGAGDPKTISWSYDTTLSDFFFTKAYRLDTVTYPNGRVIQLNYDGHNGIDDAINRLYDERKVATSYSKVYGRDEMDRITSDERGNIKPDHSAIDPNWITGGAEYELNQLGSILGVDPAAETDGQVQTFEYNDANEPTAIKYDGEHQKESFFLDYFDDPNTLSNDWELVGSGDVVSIASSNLNVTTLIKNTYDGLEESDACVILLHKNSTDIGLVAFEGDMYPTGVQPHAEGTEVGFVFGYKSPNDYYIAVAQKSNIGNVYHIHQADPADTFTTRTYIGSCGGFSGNDRFSTKALRNAFGGNDIPSGRIGIWANGTDVAIEEVQAYNAAQAPNWHGRWRYSEAAQAGKGQRIDNSGDYLRIRHRNTLSNNAHNDYAVALIDGMTVEKFQITFRAKYINAYARPMLRFAYQGDDNFFQVGVKGDGKYIYVDRVENDDEIVQAIDPLAGDIEDSTKLPNISTGNKAWFRYESDGSTITGYCIEQDTAPTQGQWDVQAPFVKYTGIANNGQGGIGLGTRGEGGIEFESVTLKSDTDGNGSYETLELVESFGNDSNNFKDMEPEHDAAGNLTFDGLRKYTYDAFNRLVKVENAFKDAGHNSGALTVGSTIAEYAYDGASRRIKKDTYVGGTHVNAEHFYCIGNSLVETRNGSDQVTQQHVWDSLAGHYIDSLAQVSNNANPGGDDDPGTAGVQDLCEDDYYALQDQQFNILAIVDDSGGVVERYEYGLYGQRTIMNDTFVALFKSGVAMNCGFQGLYHDTETGLIYNRARMFNSRLQRFNQRDPLGYPDGMNTYAAYHVMWGGVDPSGLAKARSFKWDWSDESKYSDGRLREMANSFRDRAIAAGKAGDQDEYQHLAHKRTSMINELQRRQQERRRQQANKCTSAGSRGEIASLMIGEDAQKEANARNNEAGEWHAVAGGVGEGIMESGRAAGRELPMEAAGVLVPPVKAARYADEAYDVAKAGVRAADGLLDDVAGGARVTGQALADARKEFKRTKPKFWKNEACTNAGSYSTENLDRMRQGKAPLGSDGYPMELHHNTPLAEGGSNAFDNLTPMTRTDHRLGDNYKKNHPNLP